MPNLTWDEFLKCVDRVTGIDQTKGYDFNLLKTRSNVDLLPEDAVRCLELLLPSDIRFVINRHFQQPESSFFDAESVVLGQTPIKGIGNIVFRTTSESYVYVFESQPEASSHVSGREVYEAICLVMREGGGREDECNNV